MERKTYSQMKRLRLCKIHGDRVIKTRQFELICEPLHHVWKVGAARCKCGMKSC